MFGMDPGIRLPNELLFMITSRLEDSDCLALALSRQFEGYASVYDANREGNTILVSYKYHFLTQPRSWYTFFRQHPLYPSSITILNFNDCYWMPAGLICSAIRKMVNLEELQVKGTKVSLQHLSHVFESCKKVKKLDFSFGEKHWEDVQEAVGNLDCLLQGFKSLTTLKMSTCYLNARDYLNDPWLLVIRILSWCRDCKYLAVEITYTGDRFRRKSDEQTTDEEMVLQLVKNDLFLQLDWMVNLRSLSLVKLGEFSTSHNEWIHSVHPLLLERLLVHLFSSPERSFDSLQHLWIRDFELYLTFSNIWRTDKSAAEFPLKSFYVYDNLVSLVDRGNPQARRDNEGNGLHVMTRDQRFDHVEHVGEIWEFPDVYARETDGDLRPFLPNLKYVLVDSYDWNADSKLHFFLQTHPTLEFLHMDFSYRMEVVPNFSDVKLLNLTVISLRCILFEKELVEKLTLVCPNLEILRVDNTDKRWIGINNGDFLHFIRFQKLKSLHLYGPFQLNDGAFLLQIIRQCPKLRSLHISGPLEPAAFFPNFNLFLKSAINLRDIRFGLDFRGTESLLLVLYPLLRYAPDLERLVFFDYQPEPQQRAGSNPTEMADLVVQFALKMKRLVALCIVCPFFDEKVMQDIRFRIAKNVVPVRKALWFNIGCELPTRSDPDVPGIHYNEMVQPVYYFPSPF